MTYLSYQPNTMDPKCNWPELHADCQLSWIFRDLMNLMYVSLSHRYMHACTKYIIFIADRIFMFKKRSQSLSCRAMLNFIGLNHLLRCDDSGSTLLEIFFKFCVWKFVK